MCCDVGGGKSPAFGIGCVEPLQSFVQVHRETNLLLDDFTICSLFEMLKGSPGNKAVIGKEEAGGWLLSMLEKDKVKVSVKFLNHFQFEWLLQKYKIAFISVFSKFSC